MREACSQLGMVKVVVQSLSSLHFLGPLAAGAAAKSLQSCLTLCDPRDGSPPGSPVPGILQARTLEWVAISLSTILRQLYVIYIFVCTLY